MEEGELGQEGREEWN